MSERFTDQTAIITGGVRGIGLGIARRLADEGARIILWDINPQGFDARTAGFTPFLVNAVNIADPLSVEAAARRAIADAGRVDILVNNAGVSGPVANVEDYAFDDWQRVLAVDLTGVFLCCRALLPHMKANRYGRIVNVASIAGKEGVPGIAAYSAAKHGVLGFSKSLARELVETGITVNCLAPVMAETDLLTQMTPEHIAASKAKIPMKRLVSVPEIAAMAAFVASRDCSFTTGFTFDVSGGRADY
ncbi:MULTISPECIES: SDR family NAD(P)-dependent oxidoreductase [Chelativorans]|jgi:3-oxoacyl-[acyl-carrier protein] reductase|uniref:Short-chain dehydrogenase/reductase SDR n=1 Tax=Chelativorans sp. (strain BNC1) TaxID=266779 RepID=Q11K91_CHESB|nr:MULTISPECIES: SDR family NAD(P)-dependent oxidoreductase [Chelativorans]